VRQYKHCNAAGLIVSDGRFIATIQTFARIAVRREIFEAMNEVVVLMSMHLGIQLRRGFLVLRVYRIF
jgi:hypothetical protein